MSLLGSFTTSGLKRMFFRRDAETFFYSGKHFPLPAVKTVDRENIGQFKKNYPFNFFNSPGELPEIIKELTKIENPAGIIKNADAVLKNMFDFPAMKNKYLGENIKWNYDYISEYEWKKDLSWKYDYMNFPKGTDIINPWLLGRLNQLVILGKGFVITSDDEYIEKYKSLMENFFAENTFCTGVNWTNTAEISIRLLNIIFSVPFFIHSEKFDEYVLNSIKKYILLHSVYIENNLPQEKDYNYIISIAALAAAGSVLRDSQYGDKLLRSFSSDAETLIRNNFTAEGISGTSSLLYLPHIIEALFIIKLAFNRASVKISREFIERYSRSFNVLASVLRDDDSIASIGDEFVSRILPFSNDEKLKFNFPLALGCAEFSKETYKKFVPEPSADVLFYFGKDAVEDYRNLASKKYSRISYGYEKAGLFVLRNDDVHITIDTAEIASGSKKTSGHNDILSFELFHKGHRLIVDPGTYSFYSDIAARNRLRSVKSHSSIYIDEEEPVELDGVFGIKEDLTKPKITGWHSDEFEDVLSVQHYAYARFSDPVIIKRIFRLIKEKNKFIIRDELFGGSSHQAYINLIFHPDVMLKQDDRNKFTFNSPISGELFIFTPADNYFCSLQDTLFSPSYSVLSRTNKLTAVITTKLPQYITTEITLK